MNAIEEKLWDYIDGNCSADQRQAIENLIKHDEAYLLKYNELLKFHHEFSAMEPEEPPMAFTYNVMEAIRSAEAQKPLKAAINKHIIKGIILFFMAAIAALLIFILANVHIDFRAGGTAVNIFPALKLPNLTNYITKPVIEGFLFFDLAAALVLADAFLRRRILEKQA